MADYERHLTMLPEHMTGAIRLWIDRGIWPGNFLTAVLSNDLTEAVGRADEKNLAALGDWVRFLYCYAPADCWGSPEKVEAWNERRGLNGHAAAAE